MVNVNKLKGKIVEKGMNAETLANKIGINRATLYKKMKNSERFTISEVNRICKELELNGREATEIFFSQYVASDAKRVSM